MTRPSDDPNTPIEVAWEKFKEMKLDDKPLTHEPNYKRESRDAAKECWRLYPHEVNAADNSALLHMLDAIRLAILATILE